jgi:hypothetical protein
MEKKEETDFEIQEPWQEKNPLISTTFTSSPKNHRQICGNKNRKEPVQNKYFV